jgi:hypothetical protein
MKRCLESASAIVARLPVVVTCRLPSVSLINSTLATAAGDNVSKRLYVLHGYLAARFGVASGFYFYHLMTVELMNHNVTTLMETPHFCRVNPDLRPAPLATCLGVFRIKRQAVG